MEQAQRGASLTDLEDLYKQYPRLREHCHRITSPDSDRYNCVAWVERDFARWWEPGFHWPMDAPVPKDGDDLDCYIELFTRLGFERCASPELEAGYLKIALYAVGQEFHHVAKQLRSGEWSSKAGPLYDFKHRELDALEGSGIMKGAKPVIYMRRPDDGSEPMDLEETGLIELKGAGCV